MQISWAGYAAGSVLFHVSVYLIHYFTIHPPGCSGYFSLCCSFSLWTVTCESAGVYMAPLLWASWRLEVCFRCLLALYNLTLKCHSQLFHSASKIWENLWSKHCYLCQGYCMEVEVEMLSNNSVWLAEFVCGLYTMQWWQTLQPCWLVKGNIF